MGVGVTVDVGTAVGVTVGVDVAVGVTVGVGVAVGVAVKVGKVRGDKVAVAVAVSTAAGRPRAAQPAPASRQSSNSPAKPQTRWIRGETGETDMRGCLCVQVKGERGTAAHCSPERMEVGEFRIQWSPFSLHPDLDDSYVWREDVGSDAVQPLPTLPAPRHLSARGPDPRRARALVDQGTGRPVGGHRAGLPRPASGQHSDCVARLRSGAALGAADRHAGGVGRHWLVLAIATLLAVAYGTRREEAEARHPGVALLRHLLLRGYLWACVWLRPTPGPDFRTRLRGVDPGGT